MTCLQWVTLSSLLLQCLPKQYRLVAPLESREGDEKKDCKDGVSGNETSSRDQNHGDNEDSHRQEEAQKESRRQGGHTSNNQNNSEREAELNAESKKRERGVRYGLVLHSKGIHLEKSL